MRQAKPAVRDKIVDNFMFLERELEMPDLPFVVVQKTGSDGVVSEVRFGLATQACDGAAALWVEARNGMSIERWTHRFRAGEYDQLLDKVLGCYAMSVRGSWSKIVDGTVFLPRKQSTVFLDTTS